MLFLLFRSHSPEVVGIFILQRVFGVLFDGFLVPHGLHTDDIVPLFLPIVYIFVLQLNQRRRAEVRQLRVASASLELLSEFGTLRSRR